MALEPQAKAYEAVGEYYLADRVLVLGRRPGRIKEVVDVALPRPRTALRNGPEVARLTAQVWELIHDEAVQAINEEAPL